MAEIKQKISPKRLLVCLCLLVMTFICSFPFAAFTNPNYGHNQITKLSMDEGWTVEASGKTYENVTMSQSLFPMQNKGDTFVMENVLPDEQVTNAMLCIYTIHCYIQVYVDGEKIYDYGTLTSHTAKLPGYGLSKIDLPENYLGKDLKIVLTVRENDSFTGLQAPYLIDGTLQNQYMMSYNRVAFLVTMLMILIGLTGMIASIFLYLSNPIFLRTFWLSMFAFLVGVWSMCNNNMMSIFLPNISDKSFVEYEAFYLMTVVFLLYLRDRAMAKEMPVWMKVIYVVTTTFEGFFWCFVNFEHVTGWITFPNFVICEHIVVLLTVAFYILLSIVEYKVLHILEKRILCGFAIAAVLVVEEVVRFNLQKFLVGFAENQYNGTLSICVLIIVATLFFDFAKKLSKAYYRTTRNELLQKMAYVDQLTELYNRRKAEEVFDSLDREAKSYAILNLDMNFLKVTNDTFGHDAGDRVLVAFAKALSEAFADQAVVCRMGGDEFCVILEDPNVANLEKSIEKMQKSMDNHNQKVSEIQLSTAYGYAYSHEGQSARAVYKIADERMYENKKKMR